LHDWLPHVYSRTGHSHLGIGFSLFRVWNRGMQIRCDFLTCQPCMPVHMYVCLHACISAGISRCFLFGGGSQMRYDTLARYPQTREERNCALEENVQFLCIVDLENRSSYFSDIDESRVFCGQNLPGKAITSGLLLIRGDTGSGIPSFRMHWVSGYNPLWNSW